MNLRKNFVLVVGGGVAIVLFLVALVVLLKLQARFNGVNSELVNAKARLDALHHRDPFPSEENILIVSNNLVALKDYFQELRETLQKDQIEAEPIEAAEFAPMLEKAARRLMQRAAAAGVKLPDRFAMAVNRYAEGALPAPSAIPRLVVQLKTMDALCNLLMDARVSEIISVERTIFETSAEDIEAEAVVDVRRGPRGRSSATEGAQQVDQLIPAAETNELYGAERFKISFAAHDSSAWEVLNALARSRAFAVVTDVRMENTIPATTFTERKALLPPAAATGGVMPAIPTHEERIVAGRELVKVDLVIDVYRFTVSPKEAGP